MIDAAVDSAPVLTEESAKALIASQFHDLASCETRLLGAGEDFVVFECSDLAFRFPRRAESAAWLATEMPALAVLSARLGVAVPHYIRVGQPSSRFPFVFGGYRRLRGRPATADVPSLVLARDLGCFLTKLHLSDPRDFDVPRESRLWDPRLYRERVRREMGGGLSGLPASLRAACLAFLGSVDTPQGPSQFRLIHGDLEAEHLLLDGDQALSGVIDWSDVCLSDPARDLGGLWAWGGEAFLVELLRHYGVPCDGELLNRVRFLGRCFSLLDYIEAEGEGETALALARRSLENAFSEAA